MDKETLMPKLENVMYNYMNCSMMMFGPLVRFGITFKQNQPGYTLYTKKYYHNFKVLQTKENFEGAQGINFKSKKSYIMAFNMQIRVYG